MQCRREESKGESEKLSPWSEGIGEADSLPSVAVPQKGKISKNKRSGRFFKFTIDFVVVGARDFSPEITVLPIGTEVPCSDRVPPQIPIYRAEGGQAVPISYKIIGTRICSFCLHFLF